MENSVEKSGGSGKSEIGKKTKSLDIKSLYKSKGGSEQVVGRSKGKEAAVVEWDGVRKKKRKSRKEVTLSSFEPVGKKSRSSVDDKFCVDGADSGLASSTHSVTGLGLKLNGSNGLNGVLLNGNGNFPCIPRRRRGSMGRSRFKNDNNVLKPLGSSSTSINQIANLKDEEKEIMQADQVVRKAEPSESKASTVNLIGKVNTDSGVKRRPKIKQEKGADSSKGHKRGKELAAVSSSWHAKVEDGHLAVNNGDASSRRSHSSHRKRKNVASSRERVVEKVEPSVGNSNNTHDLFHEDDEDNLEQNAARMLSSRFDPSCTGFSSKSRSSSLSSGKGCSFFVPPTQNTDSRGSVEVAESTSADAADRVLRPRTRHKGKGISRKRRHFYEIFCRDLDGHWYLNRRIKIFWPLDESWYYGSVTDYDTEQKLHHIKYDDREEEWISLQSERFKLLLFPGEVPGKMKEREHVREDKHINAEKSGSHMKDEASLGSNMETEPIISWLARSSLRVKSSSPSLKKQKLSQLSSSTVSPYLSDKSDIAGKNRDISMLGRNTSNSNCSSTLPDKSTDGRKEEKFVVESSSNCKEVHLPVVYVRRRFRKNIEASNILPVSNTSRGHSASLPSNAPLSLSSSENIVSIKCFGLDEIPWSVNSRGMIQLNAAFTESNNFEFELCISLSPLQNYVLGVEMIWLLHNIVLVQFGTMVSMWPPVLFEVLFVDNVVGLRFFLFEGCLKQVVAFVFLILTVLHEPDRLVECFDHELPMTSIRFKLSCTQTFRKQQVFAYYSFSKLTDSNWLYLDSELQPHCLLSKQLSLPECTYDNIKSLEGGSKHFWASFPGHNSSFQVLQKTSMLLPVNGVSRDSCHVNRSRPSSILSFKHGSLPPFALSFTAAPTFFLSLHLKLLMERSITSISLQDCDSVYSLAHPTGRTAANDHSHIEDISENSPESCPESRSKISCAKAARSGLSCMKLHTGAAGNEEISSDRNLMKLTSHGISRQANDAAGNTAADVVVESEKQEQSQQLQRLLNLQKTKDHAFPASGKAIFDLKHVSVEIPPFDEVDRDISQKGQSARQVSDFALNFGDGIICSPNPTGPRSLWHRNRSGSSSLSFGGLSHLLSDGKTDVIRNGFGPKRPRTQVHYSLPSGVLDPSSKHRNLNQNGFSYKRIRKANEKKTTDTTKASRKNLELVACDANLLITDGDKGWRESGARVFLECADQNEWKLTVKHSGNTKYSYKVSQDLQPGTSNRFTHAMIWKGGKDWALEFPDRSQWFLFKEMHEECHNRNIRAASIKNIPIPGVHLIDDFDVDAAEIPFVRGSKYLRQVENDVEMAMDTSRVLYDMDSEDEEWIARTSMETQEGKIDMISDELFENTMTMLEKVSYARQRDNFTVDEIEKLIVGVGPMELMIVIYEHWRQKRQRKGMALIRHLQPPLWEGYKQQVKEWELLTTKPTTVLSTGSQEKVSSGEKPPMFAFCLKPRGLEVLNKGSKHRPHRKYTVSVNNHAMFGDFDGPHSSGRRTNGFPFGDERPIYPSNGHDSSDASPLPHTSTRMYSPRDVGPGHFSLNGDASEWNHRHPKLHRNNSKKIGSSAPINNSHSLRKTVKRNGVHRWNMPLSDWPSEKYQLAVSPYRHPSEHLGGSDLDEFKLRDASSAAKHARNMAKLKRERAQKFLYMADLAIHKAVVALMTAEAIKASHGDSNNDG